MADCRPAEPDAVTTLSGSGRPAPAASPWLTCEETASYLRYRSGSAVRMLVARDQLRARGRRGGRLMFHRDDLDAFLTRSGSPVVPDAAPGETQAAQVPLPAEQMMEVQSNHASKDPGRDPDQARAVRTAGADPLPSRTNGARSVRSSGGKRQDALSLLEGLREASAIRGAGDAGTTDAATLTDYARSQAERRGQREAVDRPVPRRGSARSCPSGQQHVDEIAGTDIKTWLSWAAEAMTSAGAFAYTLP